MPPRELRLGVTLGGAATRKEWRQRARRAEAAGYDVLSVPDHLSEGLLAPLPALIVAAEATGRLRVATMVLNNDLRHPVLLASEAATVAAMTDGRFELGIGAGHMRREYEAAGIAFDGAGRRAGRMCEAVGIVRRLLRGEEVATTGDHYRLRGQRIWPVPAAPPPILVGGNSAAVHGCAARDADIVGFVGFGHRRGGAAVDLSDLTAAALERQVARVRGLAGDRAEALEMQALVQRVVVTPHRRRAAEEVAAELPGGLPPEALLDSPYLLLGTPEEIAAQLRERRERFGVSYWTVFGERQGQTIETLAPVIERLR